jgi:predicted esterase
MTYYLGFTFPKKFKAIAPFAGYLKKLEQRGDVFLSPDAARHIPVFILHGKTDNVVNISESLYAKDRLSEFGYRVKFREISGLGHEYPDYVNWIIIDWFERLQ